MIRSAVDSDLREIVSWVEKSSSAGFSWNRALIEEEKSKSQFYVLCQGAQLLSFVIVRDLGGTQEVLALMSHPGHRREGFAALLLKWLFEQRYPGQKFWLEVHESNVGARNLYEKFGFCQVGMRPNYYPDQGAAILMTRQPT